MREKGDIMTTEPMTVPPAPSYPVRLTVEYPEKLSRLLNNIPYLKLILVIPHAIILMVLGFLVYVVYVISFFAILFSGRYPRGMFDFYVNVQRWGINLNTYVFMLRDDYPPFSGEAGKYPPVTYEVDYPETSSRLLLFVRWFLIIPHIVVLFFLILAWLVVYFISWWTILFTGSYPRGLFDFSVGVFRWTYRVNAYAYFLTDQYPPFSMK